MSAAIDYGLLKNLPDEEKAKIAKIVLAGRRKDLKQDRLRLLDTNASINDAVDFFRVSSSEQREGYSLSAQQGKAEQYKKQLGLKSVKAWSVSESASKEFDRKKFFEMMDYITQNGIRNVIFDKIDRACRGLRAAVMIEDLIESGVRFHFVRDNLIVDKKSSPSEKLRFYLGVILAKHYIDNLKLEIRKGMERRQDEGYFNAKAPVGYINVRPEVGKANMIIHEELGPFMSECFELYKTGNYSRKDLENLGRKHDIKWTKRKKVIGENGEPELLVVDSYVTEKTLEKALSNPAYCQARWNGRKLEPVENCKWEAITDIDTFKACQKIKGIRAQSCVRKNSKTISKPLMQLMNCGECGHQITGEVKVKGSGKTYIYYHCANRHCSQKRINTEQRKLMAQFSAAIEPFAKLTPKATAAFIETLRGNLDDMNLYAVDEVKKLREQQLILKKRIDEVDVLGEKGLLSTEEYGLLKKIKKDELEKNEIEVQSHVKANQQTFETGLKIIELLGNSFKFMELDGFEPRSEFFLKGFSS